jgi:hypothetical protein
MGIVAGLFGRLRCSQGAVFVAVLLVPGFLGNAHAGAADTPWWANDPAALAFDPFSLSTDPGLLAFYQSLFGPAAAGATTTVRSKTPGAVVSPVPGSANTSTRTSNVTAPATTDSTSRGGVAAAGDGSLSVVRHAFLIAPRPPKRTPILPPWP